MNTQKPISTISWNSKPFLVGLLSSLQAAHKIDHWEIILHQPEDDEGGSKPHFHVYIEPSKRLQTADLRDEFCEPDLTHPDKKPLGCLPFRNSVYSDWYLYALHDPAYLAAHQQSRRFHYADDQIITGDQDQHLFLIRSVDMSQYSPIKKLQVLKDAGLTFPEVVQRGIVPIPQFSQYEKAWNALKCVTDRYNRSGHINIDESTGEVISESLEEEPVKESGV